MSGILGGFPDPKSPPCGVTTICLDLGNAWKQYLNIGKRELSLIPLNLSFFHVKPYWMIVPCWKNARFDIWSSPKVSCVRLGSPAPKTKLGKVHFTNQQVRIYYPAICITKQQHTKLPISVLFSFKNVQSKSSFPIPSMYGIFPYIWLIFMVNVDEHNMHGALTWFWLIGGLGPGGWDRIKYSYGKGLLCKGYPL